VQIIAHFRVENSYLISRIDLLLLDGLIWLLGIFMQHQLLQLQMLRALAQHCIPPRASSFLRGRAFVLYWLNFYNREFRHALDPGKFQITLLSLGLGGGSSVSGGGLVGIESALVRWIHL